VRANANLRLCHSMRSASAMASRSLGMLRRVSALSTANIWRMGVNNDLQRKPPRREDRWRQCGASTVCCPISGPAPWDKSTSPLRGCDGNQQTSHCVGQSARPALTTCSRFMVQLWSSNCSECSKRTFGSHLCRVVSVSYVQTLRCHGIFRKFEERTGSQRNKRQS
jgi:hypothetical protein